ncbi:C39 family peptidase [Salirhabdus salicampi]|uniref:C39 family peptidase n=1 Tax=Salirhabdus salicampi TaxID=476102 RepID=UPI0020C3D9CE|nr:C39 family peptidase [Salirhabdus salicampi]MCP8617126.1 C39 family peptidase [Salirhabdus salicampi]
MRFYMPFLVICLIVGCVDRNDNTNPNRFEKQYETNDAQSGSSSQPLPKLMTQENKNKSNSPNEKKLHVPLIAQNPELKYGCEVTSLAMILQYAGIQVDKMELANTIEKDHDPIKKNKNGDITDWGNPNDGFVGDMTGKNAGYAVFDRPIVQLMEKYLPRRTVNLTGEPFSRLEEQIAKEKPVLVWTTGDYQQPNRWELWNHGDEQIETPLDLHAVVLVGYDENHVYLNDPLSEKKDVQVNKETFINSWKAMKMRAVSYN